MNGDAKAPLSDRAETIESIAIREMYDLANARGGDLVRLEIGEPDFDTPAHVIDAAAAAARDGETHYTSNAGIIELREAIAEKTARDHGLEVDPGDVVATAGATEALLLVLLATAGLGDEVVLPTPCWPQYRLQTQLVDATPVEVALDPEDGFELDADPVIAAMGPETAAVVVNSPSNPTSRLHDHEAVREIAAAASEHGAYVILDEVYASLDFVGEGRSLAADLDADNLVVINACSKQYAMTGWRLGWLVAPSQVVEAATRLHPGTSTCPSSVSQHAGVAALTGPQVPAERMYEAFRERRDYVVDRLAGIDGIAAAEPQGGFYAFVDVSALDGSDEAVARRLLAEEGIVTVPGTGFGPGGEGHLRLSFATGLERLEVGFDRLGRFVGDELG